MSAALEDAHHTFPDQGMVIGDNDCGHAQLLTTPAETKTGVRAHCVAVTAHISSCHHGAVT
jgi:hypothetical protein